MRADQRRRSACGSRSSATPATATCTRRSSTTPRRTDEFERANKAFNDILAAGLALGGTVTGEHGIGKIKREWLEREIGPVGMRVHRAIKAALDPENLFNPGSMFSMP